MNFREKYIEWFRRLFPSPFVIAILLTVLTFILAFVLSDKDAGKLVLDWQVGLWNSPLLTFAFQMMLMLVLGHVLALSAFFNRLISKLIQPLRNTAQAAALVALSTILVALFNWGLGLIFGAIIARKVGEQFTRQQQKLNYPLVAAAGYSGLMVWHGGLSGSALTKVAEPNHLRTISGNNNLPEAITYVDTVFAPMNMAVTVALLIAIPLLFYIIGKRSKGSLLSISFRHVNTEKEVTLIGMEKAEYAGWLSKAFGILFILIALYGVYRFDGSRLGFITPNFINFTLLGLGLLLHQNFRAFLQAVEDAILGASGILIQFPLYFGILALMQSGGLIELISDHFISISNATTLPLFTFMSAGLVNIFVPSGGGQWAIQGPIIIEAASQINVPLNKMILALAYGDQLTNMLQPFWALPLLGITGLKAKDILPYTLIVFLAGCVIFGVGLLLF